MQQAILEGPTAAAAPADRFAVGVCHGAAGSCSEGTCSGALILPNVVATARHCVDTSPEDVNCLQVDGGASDPRFGARKPGSYFVTTNPSTQSPTVAGWYAVKSIHVPADPLFCGNDIALLVLTTAVPATNAKPVTPTIRYPMTDFQYAREYSAIAFGRTRPDDVAGGESGTRRRINDVKVTCIPGDAQIPCTNPKHNPREFGGGDGLCAGDSGSGAFEKLSLGRGAPASFGVLSRSGKDCKSSTYTRFDEHRDFILGVVKEASANWTLYPEPSWTAARPPPQPDAGPPPTNLELGAKCTRASDCRTNVCADTGAGGKICTVPCDPTSAANSACPDGFRCRNKFCLRGNSVFSQDEEDEGCHAGSSDSGAAVLWVVGLAVAVSAHRRVQRRARPRRG